MLLYCLSGFSQSQDSLSTKNDTLQHNQKKGIFSTSWGVIKNSVLTVPQDFVQIGHGVSDNWKKTAIYTAGIAGLVLVDKYTTEFYQDEIESAIDYHLPNISPKKEHPFIIDQFLSGTDAYITYSLLGIYAGSFATNYEKGQYAAVNSFKALAYSYVISHLLLKSVIGRHRPDLTLSDGNPPEYPYTSNPFDFGNLSGIEFDRGQYGTAMPSFHATAYYAVAKVMAMEFNNYWIPYTVVTGIFLSDIRGHKHWVSDMVAGGILGTLIGGSIVKSSRKRRDIQDISSNVTSWTDKIEFKLVPQISGNFVGLHLMGSF
ncbi:hypothetical protein AM493_03325 [Flavobacterium akiainvivens]|uniref:Phosphatidic acid phosphatase type 2/haloperoxidase domain-containing protein n=2 Tax=Flavobacterium akiainvivens TaxID=1202724 RepID=A0A0M8MBF2_9FLAO|nr:hypothetical protein AM493_03325 [Flavobacterium akiainvivens]